MSCCAPKAIAQNNVSEMTAAAGMGQNRPAVVRNDCMAVSWCNDIRIRLLPYSFTNGNSMTL
jgi:hypothetical protein